MHSGVCITPENYLGGTQPLTILYRTGTPHTTPYHWIASLTELTHPLLTTFSA